MRHNLLVGRLEGMLDRKPQILDVASELLQARSYTAFSYQDLSDRLGITKASIHHHFATKETLLEAMIRRYRGGQRARLQAIDEQHERPWDRLNAFLAFMADVAKSGEKICPVGALQAEINVLPVGAREEVRELFHYPKQWLASLLAEGQARGDIDFKGTAADRAALILAAIQGGLQIARATGPEAFETICGQIRADLEPST